jgi:hypothetical protein
MPSFRELLPLIARVRIVAPAGFFYPAALSRYRNLGEVVCEEQNHIAFNCALPQRKLA